MMRINPIDIFWLRYLVLMLIAVSLATACGGEVAAEKGKGKKGRKAKAETEKTRKADGDHKPGYEEHEEKKPDAAESSPDDIWADLLEGNKLFESGKYSPGDYLDERPQLAKAQHPKVIVLGCSDSRVPPELVFGKNTGDLFVVRNAGNVADAVVLGSIEYAAEHLRSTVIVVLGHESCGAVAATMKGGKMPSRNLQAIVDTIAPALKDAKECSPDEKVSNRCVELNVRQTAKQLLEKSKILQDAADKGKIKIVPAIYHLDSGEVSKLE